MGFEGGARGRQAKGDQVRRGAGCGLGVSLFPVSNQRHPRLLPVPEEARVTPIELFFDLVFVFSLTQVTALMAHDLTPRGLVRGLLVLALLWWCWVGYAWLGNVVRADEGLGRVAMFGAMAAMFVLALTVPEAFDDLPGGLDGPVVVAFAYLAVRMLHLAIFWLAGATTPGCGGRCASSRRR